MIAVDLLGFANSANQLYMSAAIGFVLGIYSFTLPNCDIKTDSSKKSWIDHLGLRAFTLFKQKRWPFSSFFR